MPLPSESTHPRRHSLAWAMALIAVLAADLAALRPVFPLQISIFWDSYPWSVLREDLPPTFPNLGLVAMVVVLEVALFRTILRRGVDRTFWLGFEVAGWASVLLGSLFARPIWRQARSVFEDVLLGRQIGRPRDMGRFVLFVGGLSLVIGLAIALLAGLLVRFVWRRRESGEVGQPTPGPPALGPTGRSGGW